mmetsp:Transcript_11033/g.24465  ORF Transcript_11033/g.24465 Transcript_11033/m.24465 type:complete len:201 (+) Transcript_11033:407-1009(+)
MYCTRLSTMWSEKSNSSWHLEEETKSLHQQSSSPTSPLPSSPSRYTGSMYRTTVRKAKMPAYRARRRTLAFKLACLFSSTVRKNGTSGMTKAHTEERTLFAGSKLAAHTQLCSVAWASQQTCESSEFRIRIPRSHEVLYDLANLWSCWLMMVPTNMTTKEMARLAACMYWKLFTRIFMAVLRSDAQSSASGVPRNRRAAA